MKATAAAGVGGGVAGGASSGGGAEAETEWRRKLSPEQYYICRQGGTERAGSSPLNHEKRHGTFVCVACETPLFQSDAKFDSGSGWPSFFQPLPDAVAARPDRSHGTVRTEVRCAKCESHLGHVFNDAPQTPTGKRFCINGGALRFDPAPSSSL